MKIKKTAKGNYQLTIDPATALDLYNLLTYEVWPEHDRNLNKLFDVLFGETFVTMRDSCG